MYNFKRKGYTKNKQQGSIAQYLSGTSFFVFAIHRYFRDSRKLVQTNLTI